MVRLECEDSSSKFGLPSELNRAVEIVVRACHIMRVVCGKVYVRGVHCEVVLTTYIGIFASA